MSPFWPNGQTIKVDADGEKPLAFMWEGGVHRVCNVSDHWRIHTNWWAEAEVWRDYWEVTTDSGLLCVLHRDLLRGAWCLERTYE